MPQLYALDPHKLMRSLEDLSLIEYAKIVLCAMKERRVSSPGLGIQRLDYPKGDPEEEQSYLVLRQEQGEVKFSRLPIRYWGNMKEEYEARNADYTGVYQPKD